jgi:hypothetical protein
MTRRMLLHSIFSAYAIAILATVACGSPTSPSIPDGSMRVTGTARFLNLEGGFWALRGEDGVTYDPKDGLPAAFQRDGMRVTAIVKPRNDLGGIHMVGPIVEILEIKAL